MGFFSSLNFWGGSHSKILLNVKDDNVDLVGEKTQFKFLHDDDPFYYKRRDCFGIRLHRSLATVRNPNAILFFRDGGIDYDCFDGDNEVYKLKKVTINFE